MRISTTILFVSLATLLAIATTYTLKRSQSSELSLLNNGDDQHCVQYGSRAIGSGFNIREAFYAENICSESQIFTYTQFREIKTSGCLKQGQLVYLYDSGDLGSVSNLTSHPC